jgi:hypothetical protein
MSTDWRALIGPHGRLARVDGGRKTQHLVRFAEGAEDQAIRDRAAGYGLTVPALLHLTGLYFQPPAGAPARFRESALSSRIARTIAADFDPIRLVLVGIGRNLNQLARRTNAGDPITAPELHATIEHVDRTLRRLGRILDLLDPDHQVRPR